MAEIMDAWQVPGAALAVVSGDEVVYLKGLGVREIGKSDPVTPDTLFAIASTTKAFTTAAIAMLVEEGKMAWNDPVRNHLAFFRLSDPLADANVTLRDLVCHRTGLSRHDGLWYSSPWSRDEIIRKIGLVKSSSSFRSRYEYQNIMFLAAGYAAGLAAGGTWEQLIQQRIFDPLGMKGANFSARDAAAAPDHASPHLMKDDVVRAIPWCNIDNVGPAGAINAGVRDLSKWLRFQIGNGTFEGKTLLPAARLIETRSPQMVIQRDDASRALHPETLQISYGLGWLVQDYRGRSLISHAGGIDGFRSQVALLPDQKLGIAVLSNLSTSLMPEAVVYSLVDLCLDLPHRDWNALYREHDAKQKAEGKEREKEREAKRQPGQGPSRELEAYTGAYSDPAYGKLSVTLENGGLAAQWSSFTSPLEHFHFDTFIGKAENTFENAQLVFTLGADGEVAQLRCFDVDFKKAK